MEFLYVGVIGLTCLIVLLFKAGELVAGCRIESVSGELIHHLAECPLRAGAMPW